MPKGNRNQNLLRPLPFDNETTPKLRLRTLKVPFQCLYGIDLAIGRVLRLHKFCLRTSTFNARGHVRLGSYRSRRQSTKNHQHFNILNLYSGKITVLEEIYRPVAAG